MINIIVFIMKQIRNKLYIFGETKVSLNYDKNIDTLLVHCHMDLLEISKNIKNVYIRGIIEKINLNGFENVDLLCFSSKTILNGPPTFCNRNSSDDVKRKKHTTYFNSYIEALKPRKLMMLTNNVDRNRLSNMNAIELNNNLQVLYFQDKSMRFKDLPLSLEQIHVVPEIIEKYKNMKLPYGTVVCPITAESMVPR